MTAVQPLIIFCLCIQKLLLRYMSKKASKAQEESSKVAADAVSNYRTITALASQDRILKMLEKAQEGPRGENIRQAWLAGVGLGISQGLTACILGFLIFWYGSKLISQGYITQKALVEAFFILVSTVIDIA